MSQPSTAEQGRVVDVRPAHFRSFDTDNGSTDDERQNIKITHNTPIQVSVELGKAKRDISEILEFELGTIVVLDKISGDPVEVMVNGELIARGEVVVVGDNYGVRITDIINS
ncbi:MAG: flagellar motor switch protein FliN [Oscillospiraceae bacterium]|nr:flagellar motor switch protein FliN [Oscillospiraceae bacterium]